MSDAEQPLPQLFIPDVVWDSTPLRIIKGMSETECKAMVKSVARRLRKNSTRIQFAFRDYPETRFLNARFVTLESLATTDEDDPDESSDEKGSSGEYTLRRKELAAEKFEEILSQIDEYRRDWGYRFLCMLALSADQGHTIETLRSASGLRLLGRAQASHMETLVLIDRLKILNKNKPADTLTAFGQEQLVLTQLIDCHLATTLQVFQKIEAEVDGKSPYALYQSHFETHAEWSESNLNELQAAESAVRVFREANSQFTRCIWAVMNQFMTEQMPEARIFESAA